MILHARWGGMIKERGLMAMAVFGNIVTSFSWFGVNMLGIGLHSYGFMDAAFRWLMFFDATQVALIILALTPAAALGQFQGGGGDGGASGRIARQRDELAFRQSRIISDRPLLHPKGDPVWMKDSAGGTPTDATGTVAPESR